MKALASVALAALALSIPGTSASAQDLQQVESAGDIPAIAGVVSDDAAWEMIWSGPMTADGMTTSADGHLLFAQEQSNAIWKLSPDGRAFVLLPYVLGAGAASVDSDGNILAVQRGCSDPGLGELECNQRSAVVQLTPERRVIADSFADGSSLGRLNDLYRDGNGGAFFTQGALYHAAADGTVTTVAEVSAFTNGLVLSPNGSTLYVTNMREVIAFDVDPEGGTSNQRSFANLSQDAEGFGGDGLAVDSEGRLYVTGDAGVYVFGTDGTELGVIPTPARSITLAFAGPDRETLYIGTMGALTPDGDVWETPEGVRNVAMTIYSAPMLARGLR